MRLIHLVGTWSLRSGNARYRELQALIARELEPKDNMTMHENPIHRRNVLRRFVAIPIELYGLSLFAPAFVHSQELLMLCAAGITACQYLRKGKDLAFASDAVSCYIPTLKEFVETSTGMRRREAADLLAQCFLLKATCVAYINANHEASLCYTQQAEAYSEIAENPMLLIAAIAKQASSYDYTDRWEQARQVTEKAKCMMETVKEPIAPHLQSYVYVQLADYQAHCGAKYKQDALRSFGKAQATFYAASNESSPTWLNHTEGNLLLHGG